MSENHTPTVAILDLIAQWEYWFCCNWRVGWPAASGCLGLINRSVIDRARRERMASEQLNYWVEVWVSLLQFRPEEGTHRAGWHYVGLMLNTKACCCLRNSVSKDRIGLNVMVLIPRKCYGNLEATWWQPHCDVLGGELSLFTHRYSTSTLVTMETAVVFWCSDRWQIDRWWRLMCVASGGVVGGQPLDTLVWPSRPADFTFQQEGWLLG